MDQLENYYREIKEAVDTKEGLKFWANNEDFTQSENYSTAPLNRFVEQMNISNKYVEAHVTFAYSHYQHPDMGKMGCHLAYQKYYETGKIPETSLPAPEAEYTAEDNGAVVNISGKISNPDKTVMGIDISKNGETIKYIDLTSKYGNAEFDFTFKDTNVSENGTLKYEIRGIDYYGNKGPAFEFSVNFEGKGGSNAQ